MTLAWYQDPDEAADAIYDPTLHEQPRATHSPHADLIRRLGAEIEAAWAGVGERAS